MHLGKRKRLHEGAFINRKEATKLLVGDGVFKKQEKKKHLKVFLPSPKSSCQ